ncbi:MAG: DUF58 domain-containing protein [Pirellula sp.]
MHLLPILAFVLLLGLITGANLFALGTCAFLLVFQLTRYYANRWSTSLDVDRTVTKSELQLGDSFAVGLKLRNAGGYFIPWLFAEDILPKRAISQPHRALEVTGQRAKLYFFAAGQNSLMTYQIRAIRRGYFQIGPTILETGDLLGLQRNYRIASEPQYILVLPKLIPLEGVNVTSRRPIGDLQVNDRAMEDPTQMVGIREYRQGDSLNRIHWRATARTGKLHTRVFQPTCIQGAMLIVDMHRASNPDRNEPTRTDLAVTAAASFAHTLYMMNQPFGLISNGRDAADRVRQMHLEEDFSDRDSVRADVEMKTESDRLRPVVLAAERGPEHFAEMHRTLARLERTDGLRLGELIMETQSRLSRQLSVLVLVQAVDDDMAMSLGMLRKRGFAVSVVLNQHEQDGFETSAGRLVAHHLPVFALPDEASIPSICRHALLMR